jgi:hypothetical protein
MPPPSATIAPVNNGLMTNTVLAGTSRGSVAQQHHFCRRTMREPAKATMQLLVGIAQLKPARARSEFAERPATVFCKNITVDHFQAAQVASAHLHGTLSASRSITVS